MYNRTPDFVPAIARLCVREVPSFIITQNERKYKKNVPKTAHSGNVRNDAWFYFDNWYSICVLVVSSFTTQNKKKTRYDYNLTIMKSPTPANDYFRHHHVEELQTCSPGHASDTWHDEIVFWNNQIIIWLFIISTFQ